VDCIHQNGDITGYSVRYGELGGRKALIVSGSAATEVTIFGLTHNTHYTVEVAAVNNAGIGHYSNPITLITDGKGKGVIEINKL